MEWIIEYLKEMNIPQLIAIAVMFWWFYSRLDKKIEKLDLKIDGVDIKLSNKIDDVEKKLSNKIDIIEAKLSNKIDIIEAKLSNKIDKLDEKVTDIDRRLCRLEGAFASKDCCMIKDDRQLRKAE